MRQESPIPVRPEREHSTLERSAPNMESPKTPIDPGYAEYLQWRQRQNRPWYSKGWVWLLVALVALVAILWSMGSLGDAVRETAEATREQTGAIRDQTGVLQEQGRWLQHQLQGITEAIGALVNQVGDLIMMVQRNLSGN